MGARRVGRSLSLGWRLLFLVALAALVSVAVFAAFSRTSTQAPSGSVGPVPSFGVLSDSSSASASASASADNGSAPASVDFSSVSSARFIAVLSDEVVWRVESPQCADDSGVALSVEISTDAGVSWTAVDFTGFDVREVLTLGPVNSGAVFAVVATGDSCTTEVLRSFTDGESWSASEEGQSTVAYINAADRSESEIRGTSIASACASPSVFDYSETVFAQLCDGELFEGDGTTWEDTGVSSVSAIGFSGEDLAWATTVSTTCTGTELMRADGDDVSAAASVGCAEGVVALPGSSAIAFTSAGDAVLWSGDEWVTVAAAS